MMISYDLLVSRQIAIYLPNSIILLYERPRISTSHVPVSNIAMLIPRNPSADYFGGQVLVPILPGMRRTRVGIPAA